MLQKYGVKVVLNAEFTPEMYHNYHFDALVLANGVIPRMPNYWYSPS